MSLLSSHTFTVEETKRFAGSFNDPARMVSAFAGVTGGGSPNNDIIVRGNSPKGILWRLEGVEIPNPNHFGNEGFTGGPINALNSNMLANSDFMTGAFSPEYGNAASGVFDIKLRNGNNQNREYSFGIGALGIDATAEGPFRENSNASFLANYRYSSLGLLDNLNIIKFQGIPKYQDGSFKLYLPTKKYGIFSVFGLGGISSITEVNKDENDQINSEARFNANLGVIGVNQMMPVNTNSYFTNSLSISTNGNGISVNFFDTENVSPPSEERLQRTSFRISSIYNTKINNRHFVKAGAIYALNQFDFREHYYSTIRNRMESLYDQQGTADLAQGFATWKYRINENLTMVSGLHFMHFLLNNSSSVEPRAAINYKLDDKQSVNIGYGKHSKLEPLTTYFTNTFNAEDQVTDINKNLSLSKAHHYVVGYKNLIGSNLLLKAEAYYQFLYNVPVENNINGKFSMINSPGWNTTRELVNAGEGRNYGLEFTLEKFLSQGYFFLLTTSVFQSEYKNLDNVWRNTQFNGNYIGNALFGKEYTFGKPSSMKTIGLSGRVTYAGGHRYIPVDLEESIKKGHQVRDESHGYSAKADDFFTANMVLYYRKDRKKTTHEIRLDVQNVTAHKARLSDFYVPTTETIDYQRQLPILPVIFYKVDF
jgi:hypothetical protein